MTKAEPTRLRDLEGVLSASERGQLAAYRDQGPGAELKREIWEKLAHARETPGTGAAGRGYRALRWWGAGVLCAALVTGLWLRQQERPAAPPSARVPAPAAESVPAAETALKPAGAETPALEATPRTRSTRPRATPTSPRTPRTDAVEELKLLTRARRVLPSRPETTLALSVEHAELYPRGVLAEEREVLAIEALLKLARPNEARQRARAFMRSFPNSSQRARLAALLEQDAAAR